MRADRLVATLLLLQTRGRVTARDVAAELEVSEKTARRDLEALAMAGLPVFSQPGRGGGWELLGGGRTDLSGLTVDEARALFLAAGAAPSVGSDPSSALRKLVRALPEPFRAEAELAARAVIVDPTSWGASDPLPAPEHLEVLRRAVVERRRVQLGYVDRERAVSDRVVEPLGLVSKGSVWYVVAGTDRGLRTFRVGRIRSAELLDDVFERPAEFDLAATWQTVVDTVGENRIRVRATVRLDASYVGALRGQFGADMMLAELDRPTADGVETVIVGGPSPLVIAQHLAGWGRLVEVIEPIEVRHHLARIARELLERYA